ncbi:MAG: UvrD-helicase domain-containing protein [Bacteriovorax sp.]|nr:UvrD-helicase domain-containing protein [Bacteriovorax sp.]
MISVSKRAPNPEQEKAIFHTGGKLLSAGAGSGKTFVLIEHLVFILRNLQARSSSSDWHKLIQSELSKIVLMTFTKKAAGEMSVRMMRKIDEIIGESKREENEQDFLFWSYVRQNLSFFNITTIHGFCHRILGLGYWNDFPQNIELVTSLEHKNKIQKIFDKWFKENEETLDPLFLASSQSLFLAMREIFESPELRVMWGSCDSPRTAEDEINKFFDQLLEVKGYDELFSQGFDLKASVKEEKKKWYEFLVAFNELCLQNGKIQASNYLAYSHFFKSIIRFPIVNSKEISPEQRFIIEAARRLREDLKNVVDDLVVLTQEFKIYKKWIEVIADLFNYIEKHYFEMDGFSFSDLEYYSLKALSNQEVLIKIQESYSYFIVDEFQDTSFIQFEILKKLTNENPAKLFCVGDRKQAIYGFRGGELQVFSDCSKLVGESNNLFLKNNFRSTSAVIDFNNQLFEKVFPLGLEYEGQDPHSVQMETQNIPIKEQGPGEVVCIRTQVVGENPEKDLDLLEAQILCDHISSLLGRDEIKSISVLYRKLKPSALLLDLFLKKNIPFSAQIKIKYDSDPLINILFYLIELHLNRGNLKKQKATSFLFETLLSVLGVESHDPQSLKQFFSDLALLGLRMAFHKFVFSLGLTNSFHAQNAEVVDAICRITKEDVVKVYHLLKSNDDETYACEMMSGSSSEATQQKRIVLMSAHASKGLEYDAVLLAGIHTNGRHNGMKDIVGKLPHSFKWKKSFDQKMFHKSPFYYLESEILKLKDFSESKRLLYVACTRAIGHLAFVDLWGTVKESTKDFYTYKNSWIQALRLMETKQNEKIIENSHEPRVDVPLIQQDSLGLLRHEKSNALGVLSELSVTRLATLAECPFKFYLQNICKITPEESGSLPLFNNEETEEEVFYSSMKRGTEIHGYLSKLFLKEITAEVLPIKEKDKILWAYSLGVFVDEKIELISEQMIKFSFFGQMISGTPDIVFASSERLMIWDFKTGIRDQENEEGYWFQLMCYAYAYGQLKHYAQDKNIEIALLYLDQKDIFNKQMSFGAIENYLYDQWKKTESLDQTNLFHCSSCSYSTICQKGKSL